MQITGLLVHTGKGEKEPHQSRGGLVLVFVFTKSTTINFQNTVTTAQVHLPLSYYSSTFIFNATFCAWIFYSESFPCPEFWTTNNWWHYSSCCRNKADLFILWHHLKVPLINQSYFYTSWRRSTFIIIILMMFLNTQVLTIWRT